MKNFMFIFVLVFIYTNTKAQTYFNKRTNLDSPSSLISDVISTDSIYYITGTRIDSVAPYLPRTFFGTVDAEGNIGFLKNSGSDDDTRYTSYPTIEELNGKFFVAGQRLIPGDDYYSLAIVYDTEGEVVTENSTKSIFHNAGNDYIGALDLAVDSERNIYTLNSVQYGNSSTPNNNVSVIKIDSLGNTLWQKAYGAMSRNEIPGQISLANDGNLWVSVRRDDELGYNPIKEYQNQITKIDTAGVVLWQHITPTEQGLLGLPTGLIENEDGSLIIGTEIGYEGQNGNTTWIDWEKYIYKISAEGELLWEKEFPAVIPSQDTKLWRIRKLENSMDIYVVGMDNRYEGGDEFSMKGWIAKLNQDGDVLWERSYSWLETGNRKQELFDIKETQDGGFVAVGYIRDFDTDTLAVQAWMLKTDSYGCLVPGCHITPTEEINTSFLDLSLYPNPASDILNIWYANPNFDPALPPRFVITDSNGKVYRTFTSVSAETTLMLSVSEFPAGIYYLSCSERQEAVSFIVSR